MVVPELPGSKFTVATVEPLSVYQGAKTEQRVDLPAPAVPVRNIARNRNQLNCRRIRDERFRLSIDSRERTRVKTG